MRKIGLISDTHGFCDDLVLEYFKDCDEIWHAGDFGSIIIAESLVNFGKNKSENFIFQGVYGNVDGYDVRSIYPEQVFWKCEDVSVFMKHIGGYPKHYAPGVKKEIIEKKPALFISGHSHILKVVYDHDLNCLHINPGAAGHHGWHTMRTIVRFTIDGSEIKNCEVVELGKRGYPITSVDVKYTL
jgi:putative phosphoesterase